MIKYWWSEFFWEVNMYWKCASVAKPILKSIITLIALVCRVDGSYHMKFYESLIWKFGACLAFGVKNFTNFLAGSGKVSMLLNQYNVTDVEKVTTSTSMNCTYKPAKTWQNSPIHTMTMEMHGTKKNAHCKIRLFFVCS